MHRKAETTVEIRIAQWIEPDSGALQPGSGSGTYQLFKVW